MPRSSDEDSKSGIVNGVLVECCGHASIIVEHGQYLAGRWKVLLRCFFTKLLFCFFFHHNNLLLRRSYNFGFQLSQDIGTSIRVCIFVCWREVACTISRLLVNRFGFIMDGLFLLFWCCIRLDCYNHCIGRSLGHIKPHRRELISRASDGS